MFCWHCGKKLAKKPGSTEEYFKLIKTRDGNEVKVHVVCVANAIESQRVITAVPKEQSIYSSEIQINTHRDDPTEKEN